MPVPFVAIDVQTERFVRFQALGVADDTFPPAARRSGKYGVVFGRRIGFQAEYFDVCARRTAEKEPGGDHFRIIEDHQAAGRQLFGQRTEDALPDLTVAINQ